MARSALLLAAALFAAPAVAAAEDETPQTPAATPAASPARPATAQPAWSPAATSGVVLAIYKKWTVQPQPKLMRTDAPADAAIPKIEIQGKDAWAEEYGMKFAFNKVSYKARF